MTLIVITGPTGVGKTATAISLAQQLHCDIINADSRQIYRGIPICTAAPTPEQLATVQHHFVAVKDLEENYNAAQFETDVMQLLPTLWQQGEYAVMCVCPILSENCLRQRPLPHPAADRDRPPADYKPEAASRSSRAAFRRLLFESSEDRLPH